MKEGYKMSLNKEQILSLLDSFNYDRSQFWISYKAALVLHGVCESTHDIDINGTTALCDKLIKDGYKLTDSKYSNSRRIEINDKMEFFDEGKVIDTISVVDGYQVENIEDIKEKYKKLNREKDQETLKKIDEYLRIKGGN